MASPTTTLLGPMPAFLLTRPDPAAARFAAMLQARFGPVETVISPLLRIEYLTADLPQAVPVFTSRNGVEGFRNAGGLAQGPCWCVGEATSAAAGAAGFAPRAGGGDAKALIAAILASGDAGPFVHVRGAHTRGDVARHLRDAGLTVSEAVVYDQIAEGLSDAAKTLLESEKPVIVPLFSPRSAGQFAKVHCGRAPLFVAAMSAAVADALGELAVKEMAIAARPDANAMLDAAGGLFDAALQLERAEGDK